MQKNDFLKKTADIRLFGEVDDDMFMQFQEQLDNTVNQDGSLIFELSTNGGDPETARRIILDLEIHRTIHHKDIYFLGKTAVYSAGVSIMAGFPQEKRYLAHDTILLIHERRLDKKIDLKDKPLAACSIILAQMNAQIETALRLQKEGFERLAKGACISADDIADKARSNWYLRAEEALELGLIKGIVDL